VGPGQHSYEIVAEELRNFCSGTPITHPQSTWTAPFQTIYSNIWQVYHFNDTIIVNPGNTGYVQKKFKHTMFGGNNPTMSIKPALEIVTGKMFVPIYWEDGIAFCDWVVFVWQRAERTWEARSTKLIQKASGGTDPGSGGEGSGLG
jgi:hypothetical protein